MTCGYLIVYLLPAPRDPGQTQSSIPAHSNPVRTFKPLVPTFGVTWLKLQAQLTTAIHMLELRPEVTAVSLPWPDTTTQGQMPDQSEQELWE